MQDTPQQQPLIRSEEQDMIVTSLGGKAGDHSEHKVRVLRDGWLILHLVCAVGAISARHAATAASDQLREA